MLKGVKLHQTYDFVSEDDEDKGTERAARFKLKMLDAFQVAALNDGMMRFEGVGQKDGADEAKVNMGRIALEAVQMALVDVENFHVFDAGGAEIPLVIKTQRKVINGRAYQVVSDEQMQHFPSTLLQEMYTKISDENGMTAKDAKKSASR